jgi:STE24 endopeptidase
MAKALTLAVAAAAWVVCAWLLTRTSVPALDLGGLDQHRFFSERALERGRSYSRGAQALWLASTLVTIGTLVVLARVLPRSVRGMGLGRIGSAVIVAMVLLVTLWFVSLPLGLASLWWQHHWGLGPFDVPAWLNAQWATLGAEAVSVLASIVLVVGLAGRFRRWWLIAGPVIVSIAALFAFASGFLAGAVSHKLHDTSLAADARRLERIEGVQGTPLGVQDVSSWTDQANAYSTGYGPSAQVVLWDTLLDGRFTRGEERVVIAHELAHVRSRHILKGIGWSALAAGGRHAAARWDGESREPAAGGARPDGALAADDAGAERRLAPLRGRGRLAGTERDARPPVRDPPLSQLSADEPRGAEPTRLGLPVARDAPDADAADRDGEGVAGVETLIQ